MCRAKGKGNGNGERVSIKAKEDLLTAKENSKRRETKRRRKVRNNAKEEKRMETANLCEGSRKGLTEGLRNVIPVDNHRAFEVGHLREGLTSFKVRWPKGEEGHPEVPVRESPEELTLRAEEVGTWEVVHQCRSYCQ